MEALIGIGIGITYFGFGLCLLQALERILESRRWAVPRVFFYIFNSIIILGTGLIADGVPLREPAALILFPSSLVIIGPLNLFYYHSLLYPARPIPYRTWLHKVPFLFSLAAEIWFQGQTLSFRREFLAAFFRDPAGHGMFWPLTLMALHVLVYMIYIAKVFLMDLGFRSSRREFRFIGSIGVSVLFVIALLYTGVVRSSPLLFIAGGVLNVMIHVYIYLGTRLFPQFFSSLKITLEKKGYERSMLSGLNKELIGRKLMKLMEEDRLFLDCDISLASVALELSLTPHQLSELLNGHLKTGFNDFINRYRVEEARRLLREGHEANITSICYRVGFNSKSTFNAAFKRITGCTPRDYREMPAE